MGDFPDQKPNHGTAEKDAEEADPDEHVLGGMEGAEGGFVGEQEQVTDAVLVAERAALARSAEEVFAVQAELGAVMGVAAQGGADLGELIGIEQRGDQHAVVDEKEDFAAGELFELPGQGCRYFRGEA